MQKPLDLRIGCAYLLRKRKPPVRDKGRCMLNTMEQAKPGVLPAQTFTIGQLAEEFGLTLRSLRFYEDEGLISPARVGQTRIYGHRDRARLKLICRGKRLGFSIGEIKDFLDLYDTDEAQVEQMTYLLRRARDRIVHLEQQLRDVQQTLKELHEIDGMIVSHLHAKGVPVQTE